MEKVRVVIGDGVRDQGSGATFAGRAARDACSREAELVLSYPRATRFRARPGCSPSIRAWQGIVQEPPEKSSCRPPQGPGSERHLPAVETVSMFGYQREKELDSFKFSGRYGVVQGAKPTEVCKIHSCTAGQQIAKNVDIALPGGSHQRGNASYRPPFRPAHPSRAFAGRPSNPGSTPHGRARSVPGRWAHLGQDPTRNSAR